MLVSLALTNALSSMFYSMDDEGHALWYDFSPEPAVLIIVCAVSIAAGVLFGLLPAVRSSGLGAVEGLKGNTLAVTARSHTAQWLVGTQTACAVALAAVAALLLANAQALMTGLGFESEHVALMRLRPRMVKYPPQRAQQFLRTVIHRLESTPGVGSTFNIVLPLRTTDQRQAA